MDDHPNGLVEKIIKELNHVLSQNGLTEFDIVPLDSNKNKSPVLYVDTSVGLESWCVKHVYNYCYSDLIEDFLTHPKRRLSRISNLNYKRIISLLNPTILINPDVPTLWNKRRELKEKKFLLWKPELQFSKLALSRRPKCNEAFAYRRWIIEEIFRYDIPLIPEFVESVMVEEINVCNKAADRCLNNYHCWDHRRWLMDLCWIERASFSSMPFFFNEYKFITHWTSHHISDYSCFHYRQFLIKMFYKINDQWDEFEKLIEVNFRENLQKIIAEHIPNDPIVKPSKTFKKTIEDDDLISLVLGNCPDKCKCYATYYGTCRKLELLFYEMVLNDELLKYYKFHETLWYHRRFIINEILATMYEYLQIEKKNGILMRRALPPADFECKNNCEKPVPVVKDLKQLLKDEKKDITWVYNCPLFKVLVKHEMELINDRQKESDKYASRHQSYLKFVEGLHMHF